MSAASPCNSVNELPLAQAQRLDDAYLIDLVKTLAERDINALTLFKKNWMRNRARKQYLRIRNATIYIQKLFYRGFFRSNRYLPEVTAEQLREERDEEGDDEVDGSDVGENDPDKDEGEQGEEAERMVDDDDEHDNDELQEEDGEGED